MLVFCFGGLFFCFFVLVVVFVVLLLLLGGGWGGPTGAGVGDGGAQPCLRERR